MLSKSFLSSGNHGPEKIIKIIFLQVFWYVCVLFGYKFQSLMLIASCSFVVFNYIYFRPGFSVAHYIFTLIFFITYGITQDYLLGFYQLVNYNQATFPLWPTALYISFLGYYGDAFNKLSEKSFLTLFALGMSGGAFSYFSAAKVSPMEVLSPWYYLWLGLGWGVFFPVSIKVFYEGFMWNKILDASIFWSFDKSGFLRHKKRFTEDLQFCSGTTALITGGTSGIGLASAKFMAKQGVNVFVTGRDERKGKKVEAEDSNIKFIQWDMADWSQLQSTVNSLPEINYLVLNAGGMPEKFQKNSNGIELQFASQLFGHFYLAKLLESSSKLKDKARIVWVTSGGMYLKSLDLSTITQNSHYDKVATYANVKRAQVTLLPYFKEQFSKQIVVAMHPGWAATPGVASAIPGFSEKMRSRLRTPLQGADTILWLLSTITNIQSGHLYFDRKKVTTHFFWFTKKSEKLKTKLIDLLNSYAEE